MGLKQKYIGANFMIDENCLDYIETTMNLDESEQLLMYINERCDIYDFIDDGMTTIGGVIAGSLFFETDLIKIPDTKLIVSRLRIIDTDDYLDHYSAGTVWKDPKEGL